MWFETRYLIPFVISIFMAGLFLGSTMQKEMNPPQKIYETDRGLMVIHEDKPYLLQELTNEPK